MRWRPRFSRSALARSIPANRSSAGTGRGWGVSRLAGGAAVRARPGSGAPPGVGKVAAARPRNGLTPRTASRHSLRSLSVLDIAFLLPVADEDDMQASRPVRPEFNALLDVSGARRSGYKIDRSRQPVGRSSPSAQTIPCILVGGDDLATA